MDAQQDQLTRLEKSVTRLETLAEGIEERQRKCDDNGERLARLEERDTQRTKRIAGLSALFSSGFAALCTALMHWWDSLHPAHH